MENANHGLTAEFGPTGVEFRRAANRWGMSPRGIGYGGALREMSATLPTADANRLEYRRGALIEWYVNGPLGLEQGFTIHQAPPRSHDGPLTMAFALSGNLTASVTPDGRTLTLVRDGATALRYAGLTAWDARRRELRAWLEIEGDQLRVRVDDSHAQFPLTIDPYVQAARLTTAKPCDGAGVCDDGAPGDAFGYSVSISADSSTVVVGVPYKYTDSVATGAAYVFVKPSDYDGGWNSIYPIMYKAKLLNSIGTTNGRRLGWSVDVSRDGGTIVVGARGFESVKGAAYVFVRPAYGWGTSPVQTETARLTPVNSANGLHQRFFGSSVAISGDGETIAVGAPDVQIDSDIGSAYVFLRPATGWVNATETQKLTGPAGAWYGSSISLSDDASILAVGAASENPLGGTPNFIGAAHVLARRTNPGEADSYSEVARLVPSDGVTMDFFGHSISASGDGSAIVVGAPVNVSETIPPHAGSAYVFVRPPTGWESPVALSETAKLTARDGWENNHLGQSVDISVDGNTIVAGALEPPSLPGTNPGPGAGYLFARPPAGWSTATENTKVLTQDGLTNDWFGYSAALSGDGGVAALGAPFQTINANVWQGAAYVFTGTAADPVASVSPSNLTFAPQSVGTTSTPQTVTVTNTGAAPLHVASVGVTGSFRTTQNCVSASPIPPGASCSESVTFAPFSLGESTATLTFTDNSGGTSGATQYVYLQGTGKTADTFTTITSLSSTRPLVGQPVMVHFSVLPEPGNVLTPFDNVIVYGSTGESCTANVASGSCTLTFSTTGSRTIWAYYTGDFYFNPSTSPGVTVQVGDFILSASPASQTVAGKKATYTLTVTGTNGFAGPVSLGCAGGPPNTTCAVAPASVNLPGSTATAKATFTLPNGASRGTYTVTFTGTSQGATRSATGSLTVR